MFDAELGQIFINMRSLLGLGLWDMARAVGAEPTIIANLEAGAIDALPPWAELTRLIDVYASLTGIDPNPILARLLKTHTPAQPRVSHPITAVPRNVPGYGDGRDYAPGAIQPVSSPHVGALPRTGPVVHPGNGTVQITQRSVTDASTRRGPALQRSYVNAPALAAPAEVVEAKPGPARPARVRRATLSVGRGVMRALRRSVAGLMLLLVVPIMFVLIARLAPGILYGAILPLPAVVGSPLRHAIDGVVSTLAPLRDGLTWIDVGDPQLRKSDRLREPRR